MYASVMEDGEEEEEVTVTYQTFPWMTCFGVIVTAVSIVLYIADTVLDMVVAYDYYVRGFRTYFALTALFVLIPAGVVTVFSCVFYIIDGNNPDIPKPSARQIILRVIFTVLIQCPLLRDFNVLVFGCKFINHPHEDKYYKRMEKEDFDSAFLRLFERFLEAAPQVTLQLFIVMHHYNDEGAYFDGIWQRISIFFSLVSLANSLTSYNHTLRTVREGKNNMTILGRVVQFLWHFCIISSRVVALAVFASAYPETMVIACIWHWIFMLAWLSWQNSAKRAVEAVQIMALSENPEIRQRIFTLMSSFYAGFRRFLLNAIFAFIHVFVYFDARAKDEPTRRNYWVFYAICLVQNTVFIFCALDVSAPLFWVTLVSYGLFFCGIFFMLIYYKWFHPSMRFATVSDAFKHLVGFCRPPNLAYTQPRKKDHKENNNSGENDEIVEPKTVRRHDKLKV